MGCMGDRNREKGDMDESQKWDYITLPDFHPRSSWTPISYAWLWFLAFIAVAVYAADTYTAVNLLAFDRWSSQIQPAIAFKYSKWIFAICIIISWALCAFEWVRAIRVIRRNGVAESYMNPLAVTLQSMRGKGWKRFLVFAELTKSKKGVDYVALFVYFQFKGAIRIILAEGARQAVNAMTLYSVMQADLVPKGTHAAAAGQSPVLQFFANIGALYNDDKLQALMLLTMLFTLSIWVISALSLIAALILYLVFLWHYIPQDDGRLSIYCRRKIDRRLEKIVSAKVKAALEEAERQRRKEEAKAVKKGEKLPSQPPRQPTLPDLNKMDEKTPGFGLVRQDTQTTLPPYSSRPPTRQEGPGLQRQPTLPDIGNPGSHPGMPARSATQASLLSNATSGRSTFSAAPSYASNAPLLGNASDIGYSDHRSASPAIMMTPMNRQLSSSTYNSRPQPGRTATQSTQASQRSYATARSGGPRPPVRNNSGFSLDQHTPVIQEDDFAPPFSPPFRYDSGEFAPAPLSRQNTGDYFSAEPARALVRQDTQMSISSQSSQPRLVSRSSFARPFRSDDHPSMSLPSTTLPALRSSPSNASSGGYVAFNPNAYSAPSIASTSNMHGPKRNMTNPVMGQPHRMMPQRSATAPIEHDPYDDLLDDYGEMGGRPQFPERSMTARTGSPHHGGQRF